MNSLLEQGIEITQVVVSQATSEFPQRAEQAVHWTLEIMINDRVVMFNNKKTLCDHGDAERTNFY